MLLTVLAPNLLHSNHPKRSNSSPFQTAHVTNFICTYSALSRTYWNPSSIGSLNTNNLSVNIYDNCLKSLLDLPNLWFSWILFYSKVMRIFLEVTKPNSMNLSKSRNVGSCNREDWKKSLRNQVWGTNSEEWPPDLSLTSLDSVCFSLALSCRYDGSLMCGEKGCWRPRFIPLSLTSVKESTVLLESIIYQSRKDLDWSHMSPTPTPLIRVF